MDDVHDPGDEEDHAHVAEYPEEDGDDDDDDDDDEGGGVSVGVGGGDDNIHDISR